MSKKKKQPLIFSATEVYGNLVDLHASTWVGHVLVEHPEMMGYEQLVEQVLKDPYEVLESTLYSVGAAFVSERGIVRDFPEGIRVLVRYNDASYEKGSTTGIVATAYPIDAVRYKRPNLGKTLYRKKK